MKRKHKENIIKGLNKKENHSNSKVFFVYDKEGKEFLTTKGLSPFCKEYNLNYATMYNISKNFYKSFSWHKGYTIFKTKPTKKELQKRLNISDEYKYGLGHEWVFIKNNKTSVYNRREEFCKEHNMAFHNVRKMTDGEAIIDGWRGFKSPKK